MAEACTAEHEACTDSVEQNSTPVSHEVGEEINQHAMREVNGLGGEKPPTASKSFRELLAESSKRKVERKTNIDKGNDFLSFRDEAKPHLKHKTKDLHESPVTPHSDDVDHRSPWARGRKYVSKSRDRTISLHEEILDFVDFISPTAAENKRRSFLLQHFQQITKEMWPSASLHVFGSYATGLHLPSSDIDCVVLDCDDPHALQGDRRIRFMLCSHAMTLMLCSHGKSYSC